MWRTGVGLPAALLSVRLQRGSTLELLSVVEDRHMSRASVGCMGGRGQWCPTKGGPNTFKEIRKKNYMCLYKGVDLVLEVVGATLT